VDPVRPPATQALTVSGTPARTGWRSCGIPSPGV
jgi:hypothetical protein